MRADRYPRWYLICRQCGWTWSLKSAEVQPGVDVVCPRAGCRSNMRHWWRDDKGIPILDDRRQPQAAIELCETADRVRAWKRLNFAQEGRFMGSYTPKQEVKVPGWLFDCVMPHTSHASFAMLLLLIRLANDAGEVVAGLETLSYRLSAKSYRPGSKGDRRNAHTLIARLQELWVYYKVPNPAHSSGWEEKTRPLVNVEHRGKANRYHLGVWLPPAASDIRVSGAPKIHRDALAGLRGSSQAAAAAEAGQP